MLRKYFSNIFVFPGLLVFLHQVSRVPALQQVQSPPYIRSVPTTVRARENASAVLPCRVDNLGAATVQWWRGDAMLAERTALINWPLRSVIDSRFTLRTDNSLEVEKLAVTDTGDYMCQVIRLPPWLPINQTHSIDVLYPASLKLLPEDDVITIRIGEEVDLLCDAQGVPQPVVLWTFKGYIGLAEDELRKLRRQPRLQFNATTRHMTGEYRCEASNDIGPPAAAVKHLVIQHPPEITPEKAWVHTSPGLRAELTCIVAAEPHAQVTWHRDVGREQLEDVLQTSRVSRLVAGDRHSLLIRNVREADLCNYTCRASNALGQTNYILQLSGLPNPAVIKSDPNMAGDKSYSLIWEVDSYSPIYEYMLKFRKYGDVEWRNLTVPGAGATDRSITLHSHTFRLNGLEIATQYEAQISSRNRFGWSAPSSIFPFSTLGPGEVPLDERKDVDEEYIEPSFVPVKIIDTVTTSQPTSTAHSKHALPIIIHLFLIYLVFIVSNLSMSHLLTTYNF